jgi:hypothetical protein
MKEVVTFVKKSLENDDIRKRGDIRGFYGG